MSKKQHPPKGANDPGEPGEIVAEGADAPTEQGISRREFVEGTGKLAYIAPTLLTFSLASMSVRATSHPPPNPPPGTGQSFDPVDDECSQWLSPDCID